MVLYPLMVLPNRGHTYFFKFIFTLLTIFNQRVITRISHKLNLVTTVKTTPREILYQTYFNVIDMLRFATKFKKVYIERTDGEVFKKMASDTLNHVVFGIHTGAFELMHMSLSNNTKPTYVLTASLGKWVDPLVMSLRKHPNTFYIQPEEYPQYHKKIITEPCIVAVLIDQSKSEIRNCAKIDDLRIPLFSQLIHTLYQKDFKVSSIETYPIGPMSHRVSIAHSFKPNTKQSLGNFIESEVQRIFKRNPTEWIWHYPIREFF